MKSGKKASVGFAKIVSFQSSYLMFRHHWQCLPCVLPLSPIFLFLWLSTSFFLSFCPSFLFHILLHLIHFASWNSLSKHFWLPYIARPCGDHWESNMMLDTRASSQISQPPFLVQCQLATSLWPVIGCLHIYLFHNHTFIVNPLCVLRYARCTHQSFKNTLYGKSSERETNHKSLFLFYFI